MVFNMSSSYLDDIYDAPPWSSSSGSPSIRHSGESLSRAVRSIPRADPSPTRAAWSNPAHGVKLSWLKRLKKKRDDHNTTIPKEDLQDFHFPGSFKRFSPQEILVITDKFSHVVGEGAFGTVYRGRLVNGSLVAVKRLKNQFKGFLTEFKVSTVAKHRNLVPLIGFSVTTTERFLVYPFMAKGAIASHLRPSGSFLEWPLRIRIALGVAKALAYLHEDCAQKIIHRDVKAPNVLLDENFEVALADSGLAVFADQKETEVETGHVAGTAGYVDPEYIISGKCSVKTDVYGYGVLLLELISGRDISDLTRVAYDYNVFEWVKKLVSDENSTLIIDPYLQGKYDEDEMADMINLIILCTERSPCRRPTMLQVVRLLERECVCHLLR